MGRYVLSPAAQADLDGIWDYTVERWSVAQAETYARSMQAACTDLAAGRLQGQNAGDIRPGYRKQRVGSHVLFFKVRDDGVIDIIRILHGRMDIPSQL